MEFVVFLLAYVLRRKLDGANLFSGEVFWRKAFGYSHSVVPGKEASLSKGLLMVAVPVLLLFAAEYWLRSAGWSLAVHPLAFLLLLGLMGTPGLGRVLDDYGNAWRRGDMQGAWRQIHDLLPPVERGAAGSPEHMHRALSDTLIARVFEHYFVIAFWYVIGGPAGAFAAGGLIGLRDHWPHAAARPRFGRLAGIVSFLPARLLGLTFGIAGDLAGWLSEGRSAVLTIAGENRKTLIAAANSSLTGYELEPERFSKLHPDEWPDFGERSLAAIRGLLNRSMLVWICGFALLVIAGVV
ncbi:regulatory signaling modulator protein AmpE [Marinobacter confluentis]|uniref:Histidine kinase n=1 Tax=Marinobacter confluentis TaxID=1697557 RepID=A0A4Z1CCR8_9GAMM|nr:regulatory signaling modulator protein AmpE [Marinobacter confluentis]TGN41933.1 histidine kinase [Marinobacter confluentis]